MNAMHSVHFSLQARDKRAELAAVFVYAPRFLRSGKRHSGYKLIDDVGFFGFFGIKLQTEITYADIL